MTSDMWAEYCEWLSSRGYSVLCYDMFGHGHSSVVSAPYTPHTLSNQLLSLLNALSIQQPAHIVGFSLGCLVASLFTTSHPLLVRSLTLIAPAAGFNDAPLDFTPRNPSLNLLQKGLWAYKHVPPTPRAATYLGGVILGALSEHVHPLSSHLQSLKEQEMAAQEMPTPMQYLSSLRYLAGQWLHQHRRAPRQGVLRSFVCEGDVLGDYSGVVNELQASIRRGMRILVLHGQDDPLVPESLRSRLDTRLKGARIAEVRSGKGHNVPLRARGEVMQVLGAFLDRA